MPFASEPAVFNGNYCISGSNPPLKFILIIPPFFSGYRIAVWYASCNFRKIEEIEITNCFL